MRFVLLAGALPLAIIFATAGAEAATNYINNSARTDGNAGTSPAPPCKNAPRMVAYSRSETLIPSFEQEDPRTASYSLALSLASASRWKTVTDVADLHRNAVQF